MKIIALNSQKGGAGKTTLAVSLAIAAVGTGLRVAAIDLDYQGSLADWWGRRQQPIEGLSVRRFQDGRGVSLEDALAGVAEDYDIAILDCPGKHDPAVAAAMRAASLVLIPTRPSAVDLAATRATVLAAVNMRRPFAFVLNQCPTQPRNPRARQVADGLGALGIVAHPFLGQRADYQDAFSLGLGVSEFEPDGRAADEIRQLWSWTARNLEGNPQWTTEPAPVRS